MMGPYTLLAVGDLVLPADAGPFFDDVRETLKQGDVVIGQLEVPYTERDEHAVSLGRVPDSLRPLKDAGFHVLTMAGNHLMDAGPAGIEDTIRWLELNGIGHVGAGMNLEEARKPYLMTRGKTRFGFLNYNCVGPKETWAGPHKPGNAYIHVITHYEETYASPGGPPSSIYTWALYSSIRQMEEDIRKLRSQCDVLTVSFHKGIGHIPVKIAQYEHEVSYAAIDAGADVVFAHHAHILKGIEVYKGKPIYHGLCNFVTYVPAEAFHHNQNLPASWAKKRKELFGFEPDPEYPTYPFHPEAIHTMIAKCTIENGRITSAGYIPCLITKEGKPVIARKEEHFWQVFNYVERISREAGLDTRFERAGHEVRIVLD